MPSIREVLVEQNPWWKEPFGLEYKDREVYRDIQKFLRLPQVIALTGLRRVGKTTLLLKVIQDTIQRGTDPKDILYFSFDEFRRANVRDVLKEYEAVVERDLRKGRHLVLLDEIQKLEGWEDQLKAIYDAYRKCVKFVVSGSESLFIRRGTRETLAGRMFEFKVEPLTFREYLAFLGAEHEPVGVYEKELARHFDRFAKTMGFPELVGIDDRTVVRKYVRESIVERVIYRDLPGVLRVRDMGLMEALLNIVMDEPGQILLLTELSKELGVSRQTVSNYLSYLEDSFLVRKLYNYSPGRRKIERKLKKYYPTVVSPTLLFREDELSQSRAFEWLIVNQLRAEFFWRDTYKNEVDVVLGHKKPVPVEVKFGKVGTSGLEAFMRKFRAAKGYVVTREWEETRMVDGKTITAVPAFKFLLRAANVR